MKRDSLSDRRTSQADPASDAIVAGHARNYWQGQASALEAEVARLRAAIGETLCDDEPCARCRHLREALNETPLGTDENHEEGAR